MCRGRLGLLLLSGCDGGLREYVVRKHPCALPQKAGVAHKLFNTNTKMVIMKIFGRTLKEYLWPVKYYVLGSVLVVISQYAIALPLRAQYPFLLNVTQGLWAGVVALSITTLIRDHGFGMKNVLFTGVLFCFIIHGLKISIRYVFYGKTVGYLIDRFLYGSLLVMCIPVIIGPVLIYFRNKGVHF